MLDAAIERIIPGSSVQAHRMRAFAWPTNMLGPPSRWPGTLRTAVRIALAARFPMVVWWGPQLIVLPNDAACELVGPDALGRPCRDVFGTAISGLDNVALYIDREVPHEEVYASFSISPLDDGALCAIRETTRELLETRRTATLHELASVTACAGTDEDICSAALAVLADNPRDVPFAALYTTFDDRSRARLAAAFGLADPLLLPSRVSVSDPTALPLAEVLHGKQAIATPDSLDVALPGGPWPEPSRKALVIPLRAPGRDIVLGMLVAGISPRRPFDDAYRTWLELCAASIASALASARAAEVEREAAEAERKKDELVAMIGHELRNPLAPILTTIQLMQLRGTQSRELDLLERQVGHITRLLDDLADVTRLARGKVVLATEAIELAEIVDLAIEMARPVLEARGHVLDVSVPRHGLAVEADPARIQQVVYNVLANAAKYSDAGTRIHVGAHATGGRVQVAITDEGVGIRPEMLHRVFDVFVQQPESLDRSRGGLGLAIVRGIVELHGGTVAARSAGPGRGTEIAFDLPAASSGRQSIAERPPTAPSLARRPQRILVVDDNQAAAESLGAALQELGYAVEVAHDGPAALEIAKVFKPQIALLDLGLPIMDGYELAQRLRAAREPAHELRLVAVTGFGRPTDRRRTAEAGFTDHLVKPVDLAKLEQIVEDLRA